MSFITDTSRPSSMAFVLGSVALMIPAAILANLLVFRQRVGTLFSVSGRIRWVWMGKCLLLVAPLLTAVIVSSMALSGELLIEPKPGLMWVLLVIIIGVPLQTLGEELVFRSWIPQTLGMWFSNTYLSYGFTMVVSTAIFVVLHGATDPWVIFDLTLFALFAFWLMWLTGGVEAALSVHLVNNLVLFVFDALSGGQHSSYADSVKGSLEMAVFSLILTLVEAGLFYWLYRREVRAGRLCRVATARTVSGTWSTPPLVPSPPPADASGWCS